MENLKVFFTRRPERLLGRCGMLFLGIFCENLSSCNDDFIEDDGGEVIPPEDIVTRLFICYWMGPISRE